MKLDLDTIFSLLFLIFFIVVPLVSRAQRRSKGGTAGSPADPRRPAKAPGDARAPRPTATPMAEDESLPGWLREAQRRVREAQTVQDEARGGLPDTGRRGSADGSNGGRLTQDTGGLFETSRQAPTASTGASGMGREGAPQHGPGGLGRMTTAPSVPASLGREARPGQGAGSLGRESRPTVGPSALGREAGSMPRSTGQENLPRPGSIGREASPTSGRSALGRESRPIPRSLGQGSASRPAPLGREAHPASATGSRDQGLGREGLGRRASRGASDAYDASGTPSRRTGARQEAGGQGVVYDPRMGKRPHAGTAGATLGAAGLLSMDRGSIVRGLIWHEILGEPAWKRHGRKLSRHRSR